MEKQQMTSIVQKSEITRIVKLMEKKCIIEDDEDAKKEGFKNLEEYNCLVELNETIKNFVETFDRINRMYKRELSSKDINDLKRIIVQTKLLNKKQK